MASTGSGFSGAGGGPANRLFAGDVWTWTSICADSKLICNWFIGGRDADFATLFMDDLADRLSHRVQLTTDGHKAYLNAIENAFGNEIDYAQLVKLYGAAPESAKGRYSPAQCTGIRRRRRSETRKRSTSARHMPSAITLRCGCTCAALLG